MEAKIVREGGGGGWKIAKYNKFRMFKAPVLMQGAGKSGDGFYLFNSTTGGRAYYVYGPNVNAVRNWFSSQEDRHGFCNDMYANLRDVIGHDEMWESLYSEPRTKEKEPVRGAPHRPHDPGKITFNSKCYQCGKNFLSSNMTDWQVSKAKKKLVKHNNAWFCSEECAIEDLRLFLVRQSLTQAEAEANVQPVKPVRPIRMDEDVQRHVRISPAVLSTQLKLRELNPAFDFGKQLLMNATGMTPGGSANVLGEVVVDSTGALNDMVDQIRSNFAKTREEGAEPIPRCAYAFTRASRWGQGPTMTARLLSNRSETALLTQNRLVRSTRYSPDNACYSRAALPGAGGDSSVCFPVVTGSWRRDFHVAVSVAATPAGGDAIIAPFATPADSHD